MTYAGLEPIDEHRHLHRTVVFNLPSTSSNDATLTASGGQLVLSGANFETTSFAAPTGSLTINFGSQGDTLTIGDLGSVYAGSIVVNGGAGSDTLAAPDVSGTWDITGVDAGTYTWLGGPTVTFASVENLHGAPTQADTFQFETGGALTGTVDAGGGTLTVDVAGFVQVSGNYSFGQQTFTGSYAGSSSGAVTNANVLTVSGSSGTGLRRRQPPLEPARSPGHDHELRPRRRHRRHARLEPLPGDDLEPELRRPGPLVHRGPLEPHRPGRTPARAART